MAYTGRATYDHTDAIYDDVSPIVSMNAKTETPFLDFLGDPDYPATSTKHEWLEDDILPRTDTVAEDLDNSETDIDVTTESRFRVYDVFRIDDELFLVTAVSTTLTCTRGYGDTTAATHSSGATIYILGNAAEEGGDADASKSVTKTRKANYTQIIRSATINVSDTHRAVNTVGGANEYEYQKAVRTMECMRDLENFVISGSWHATAGSRVGASGTPRTMQGLKYFASTNANNASSAALTETLFNTYLQTAWQNGAYNTDFALVPAYQKMVISGFKRAYQMFDPASDTDRNVTNYYQTDFQPKPIKLILCRWIPSDEILMGDSSKVKVLPLQGMSFYHKPLAVSGDYQKGFVQGEYTLEARHEESVVWIYSLATS